MMNRIFITLDTDWAPDFVIADCVEIIANHCISATLFATHKSAVLDEASQQKSQFEIGIHPNFNNLLQLNGEAADVILGKLLEAYPKAVGERSHSRTISSPILSMLRNRGLLYEANQIIPFQKHLQSYVYDSMVRFTDFWQDDVLLMSLRGSKDFFFSPDAFLIDGLKIVVFHPVHIYLNTDCTERYIAAKPHLQDKSLLSQYRNTNNYGIRDYFMEFLTFAISQNDGTKTLEWLARHELSRHEKRYTRLNS